MCIRTKSGLASAVPCTRAGYSRSWCMRMVPYMPLLTTMKITLAPYCTAVASSCPHIRKQPSPFHDTTVRSGCTILAAIAAKIVHPERTVVSWNGDGCFLMCGQELATAVQYGANVIFIVVNNGMYGTIRMHQEREYPARVHGTALVNPDFV